MDGFVQSITLPAKALAGVMAGSYIVQLAMPIASKYLALVSGKALPCIWMIVTSGLFENSLINVLISILAVLLLTRIVEPVYGTREYIRFLLISLAGSGALTVLYVTTLYYIMVVVGKSDDAGDMLYYPICGFSGGIAALLVAVKQIIPDNDVTLLNFIHFRAKHLAAIYLVLSTAAAFLLGVSLKIVPFAVYGTFVAWFYLRFFQYRPETGIRGDPADSFKFASFFPESVQAPVDALAIACSKITGLDVKTRKGYQPLSMPAATDSDAARRRERGAKALEERLGMKVQSAKQHPSSSPIKTVEQV